MLLMTVDSKAPCTARACIRLVEETGIDVYGKEAVEQAMGQVGLDRKIRAEGLTVEEWGELYKRLTTDD